MEPNNQEQVNIWTSISKYGSGIGTAWHIEANPYRWITLKDEDEIATEITLILDTIEIFRNDYVTYSIR